MFLSHGLFAADIFTIVQKGSPEEVRGALAKGVKVTDRDAHGLTPLMLAARSNPNPEVTTILLAAGASVDDRDPYGVTPLMFAAGNNKASSFPTVTKSDFSPL